jgi:hypothetical protein
MWTQNAAYRERAEARLEELGSVFAIGMGWCGQEATEEFRELIALRQEVDPCKVWSGTWRGGLRTPVTP